MACVRQKKINRKNSLVPVIKLCLVKCFNTLILAVRSGTLYKTFSSNGCLKINWCSLCCTFMIQSPWSRQKNPHQFHRALKPALSTQRQWLIFHLEEEALQAGRPGGKAGEGLGREWLLGGAEPERGHVTQDGSQPARRPLCSPASGRHLLLVS